MKKYIVTFILCLMLSFSVCAAESIKEQHIKFIYPVVRVSSENSSGSGTVVYSKVIEENIYSTYILTNYHVISDSISIIKEWDSKKQKEVDREHRSIVYVEMFKYKNISIPIGTLKVEADIIVYNKLQDTALLKLRSEEKIIYIANLPSEKEVSDYHVLDETIAVGCSLSFPPLPTRGMVTRQNFQIESFPYNMSSSQIVYGNSGGALFLSKTGKLIGIPSKVAIVGFGTPITHMGLFIPIERVYKWLKIEGYEFIYNDKLVEKIELEKLKINTKEEEEK